MRFVLPPEFRNHNVWVGWYTYVNVLHVKTYHSSHLNVFQDI